MASNTFVSIKHGDTEFATIKDYSGQKILTCEGTMINEDIILSVEIPYYDGQVIIHE